MGTNAFSALPGHTDWEARPQKIAAVPALLGVTAQVAPAMLTAPAHALPVGTGWLVHSLRSAADSARAVAMEPQAQPVATAMMLVKRESTAARVLSSALSARQAGSNRVLVWALACTACQASTRPSQLQQNAAAIMCSQSQSARLNRSCASRP